MDRMDQMKAAAGRRHRTFASRLLNVPDVSAYKIHVCAEGAGSDMYFFPHLHIDLKGNSR
jgi:hypothetical protein